MDNRNKISMKTGNWSPDMDRDTQAMLDASKYSWRATWTNRGLILQDFCCVERS